MKYIRVIIFIFSSFICIQKAQAEEVKTADYSFTYTLNIDSTEKPKIVIQWQNKANTEEVTISKKLKKDNDFGKYYTFIAKNGETQWVDTNIIEGIEYEYGFEQFMPDYSAYGYCSAGFNVPLTDYRGRILLLIDTTLIDVLKSEINQLVEDITGDGWLVKVRYAPRAETFDYQKIIKVKTIISEEFSNHQDSLRAIFILGRIPVPYSGNDALDRHIPEHSGAYGTDLYYASFSNKWNDQTVNSKIASDERQWNVPNDGKFDNDLIPDFLTLECGRVDLFDLPDFKESEVELLRNYINKNHNYRHKINKFPQRAIIGDNFGVFDDEAFASDGWLNFTPLVSKINIDTLPFISAITQNKYLFAYGCGPGSSFASCYNIATTADLAVKDYNAVFTMFFGSYIGDWDTKNNLLRAMLANKASVLTCAWAGRPYWFFHNLGMGETIGYSAKLTQNNSLYGPYISNAIVGARSVQVGFMGDPTLKMHIIEPVSNLNAELIVDAERLSPVIQITWDKPNEEMAGYNIYRYNSLNEKFLIINKELLTETNYIDNNIISTEMIYQVRAVKKEFTPTGSYWNQSVGKFCKSKALPIDTTEALAAYVAPNPAKDFFTVTVSALPDEVLTIELFDILGNTYGKIYEHKFTNRTETIKFNVNSTYGMQNINIEPAIYFLKFVQGRSAKIVPMVVIN